MTDDPCFLAVAEASRRIAARRLSLVACTQALVDRIAAIDGRSCASSTVPVTAG